jgi:hypothetical protein
LAALISGAVCSSVPFFGYIVDSLWKGRGLPGTHELNHYLAVRQPEMASIFGWLLVLLSVPMVVLWAMPLSRPMLSVLWKAALCGGCLGVLLSPAWYFAVIFLDRRAGYLTVSDYLDVIHVLLPSAVLTGALYFFLHYFFIRQALGKKAWLETQG